MRFKTLTIIREIIEMMTDIDPEAYDVLNAFDTDWRNMSLQMVGKIREYIESDIEVITDNLSFGCKPDERKYFEDLLVQTREVLEEFDNYRW